MSNNDSIDLLTSVFLTGTICSKILSAEYKNHTNDDLGECSSLIL